MLFYWGLWAFFLVMSIFWKNAKNKNIHYIGLMFCIFVLSILAGGREWVGSDWWAYRSIYLYGYSGGKDNFEELEIGFRLIIVTCRTIGLSYGGFCFVITLIALGAICIGFKKLEIKNCWLAFLVYLSLFFCNYQFNIVRHGLMSAFMFLGFAYLALLVNDKKIGKTSIIIIKDWIFVILCFIASISFHIGGVLFIAFIPFVWRKFDLNLILGLASVSLMIYFTDVLQFFGGVLDSIFPATHEGYLHADNQQEAGFSLGTISKFLIFIYVYFVKKKLYEQNLVFRLFSNMLLFSLLFIISFNHLGIIIERLGNTMAMSLAVLIPYLLNKASNKNIFSVIDILFYIYIGYYYYISWSGEDSRLIPFIFKLSNLV